MSKTHHHLSSSIPYRCGRHRGRGSLAIVIASLFHCAAFAAIVVVTNCVFWFEALRLVCERTGRMLWLNHFWAAALAEDDGGGATATGRHATVVQLPLHLVLQ